MTDEAVHRRLDALEITVAHQDATIADLNRMVTRQWSVIDELRRRIDAIGETLDEAVARAGDAAPQKPPPHW